MHVDTITAPLVTAMLRAWQHGQEPPAQLLELDLLGEPTAVSPTARAFALQDHVSALAEAELARLRQAAGLATGDPAPLTRPRVLQALRRDFNAGGADLQAWSALTYRYLTPFKLSTADIATAVPLDPRSVRRHVRAGVDRLVTALQRQEIEAHGRARARARARHLPPPDYTRLFGIDNHLAALAARLRAPDGPVLISIEGLGGSGKTALARAVAADLARDSAYDGIAWISARQTWLNDQGEIQAAPDPVTSLADIAARLAAQLGLESAAGLDTAAKLDQIGGLLAAAPQLIVIDNLETVSDIDALLPALMPLASHGRFLLTSRQGLSHHPLVHSYPLPPLSRADSQALVESELSRHGRDSHLTAAQMDALYALLGGVPLALKLVAAHIGRWPLDALLDELRSAGAGPPQGLYTYIYRRAWLVLDDPARRLLLSLLTVGPDGEDLAWLQMVSLLDEATFHQALAALLSYSLLETAGSPAAPSYRLHRLTATFLQTDILSDWNGPAPASP